MSQPASRAGAEKQNRGTITTYSGHFPVAHVHPRESTCAFGSILKQSLLAGHKDLPEQKIGARGTAISAATTLTAKTALRRTRTTPLPSTPISDQVMVKAVFKKCLAGSHAGARTPPQKCTAFTINDFRLQPVPQETWCLYSLLSACGILGEVVVVLPVLVLQVLLVVIFQRLWLVC